jgi:hypothetical protein
LGRVGPGLIHRSHLLDGQFLILADRRLVIRDFQRIVFAVDPNFGNAEDALAGILGGETRQHQIADGIEHSAALVRERTAEFRAGDPHVALGIVGRADVCEFGIELLESAQLFRP